MPYPALLTSWTHVCGLNGGVVELSNGPRTRPFSAKLDHAHALLVLKSACPPYASGVSYTRDCRTFRYCKGVWLSINAVFSVQGLWREPDLSAWALTLQVQECEAEQQFTTTRMTRHAEAHVVPVIGGLGPRVRLSSQAARRAWSCRTLVVNSRNNYILRALSRPIA